MLSILIHKMVQGMAARGVDQSLLECSQVLIARTLPLAVIAAQNMLLVVIMSLLLLLAILIFTVFHNHICVTCSYVLPEFVPN